MKIQRNAAVFLFLCLAAAPAGAGYKPPVKAKDVQRQLDRADIEVSVAVTGLATAQDSYDIFAPFEGRVENVSARLFDLAGTRDAMASLVSTQMAALLDSSGKGNKGQVEKRWQGVYDYYPVKPEAPGIVTNVYASPKAVIYKGDRLFTVAKKIVIIGRNREKLFSPLAKGMTAELACAKDPSLKLKATLVNFMPMKDEPGFQRLWLEVSGLRKGIRVGDQFDGTLTVGRSENAMFVPKNEVVRQAGKTYLVLEVETGLESEDRTEILKSGMRFVDPAEFEIRRKEGADGKSKKTE